jgi:peroxidase
VNEQPSLNLVHQIFMREHNRIVDRLAFDHPNWNDETLYQEGRRVAIAEYQHILYNEWLPIILGKQFMNSFGLFTLAAGYSRDYDAAVDPRINNEFAAAGMRFGHSLIPGLINVYNRVGQETNPAFRLRQAFLKPDLLRLSGMVDGLIAGEKKGACSISPQTMGSGLFALKQFIQQYTIVH